MRRKLYYMIRVTDKFGRTINKPRLRSSHSFLIAFNQIGYAQFGQATVSGYIDIYDATITVRTSQYNFNCGSTETYLGPIVGTGTTAVTINDNKLETRVEQGVGAGQMDYLATTVTTPVTSGSTRRFQVQRTMNNDSGADINVSEIGLYAVGVENMSLISRRFCIIRDVLDSAKTVPNTGAITVTYVIAASV